MLEVPKCFKADLLPTPDLVLEVKVYLDYLLLKEMGVHRNWMCMEAISHRRLYRTGQQQLSCGMSHHGRQRKEALSSCDVLYQYRED